jgi:hypothetical protein
VSVVKRLPRFAKILILVQSIMNLFLSFWIYEEYQSNSYLQSYVNGYFQGGFFSTIALISMGGFSIVAVGLYAKLRSARRALDRLVSSERMGPDGRRAGQGLDARTEQHLIDMIRKTTPIMSSGTSGQMPTLRRTDSPEEQGSGQ